MDFEFTQFHPTGIPRGFLITEGARGEGGFLLNSLGERFMSRYAKAMELAPRDVVSRSIAREIEQGRGCGSEKDHVFLSLRHLPASLVHSRLPGVVELAKNQLGIDAATEPIPVVPTAHYSMGGIPTTLTGKVRHPTRRNPNQTVPGLWSAGEAACVSVHGANRLGANSLLETIVFGRAAGIAMAKEIENSQMNLSISPVTLSQSIMKTIGDLNTFFSPMPGEEKAKTVEEVKLQMQKVMSESAGVFRDEELLTKGISKLRHIQKDANKIRLAPNNHTLIWYFLIFLFSLKEPRIDQGIRIKKSSSFICLRT
jgi:succinate dehydrogenase / fumarate reductase flavoprotein subunit